MEKAEKIRIAPKYTLGEELFSAISHGIGAMLSIAALVLTVIAAAKMGRAIAVVSCALYGATLIILYTMSTLYHSFKADTKVKRVFRIFDHCSIFLLIFGTYIPIALIAIGGATGWILFGIGLTVSILGITLNAINLEKYKVLSMICYIAMGWMIIFNFKSVLNAVEFKGIVLLVIGGIVYTIGAIIYGVGKKVKYMHSIWHLFVLAGSILQFFTIYLYIVK